MTSLSSLAMRVLDAARERKLSIVTAESCTLLSEVPDAGEQLHGGFVTYSKTAKAELLGVSEVLLQQRGAVCANVAVAMTQGALERSPPTVAVAITGVAGPEPDDDGNPVGLCASRQSAKARRRRSTQKDTTDISVARRFWRKRWRMRYTKCLSW